MIIDITISIKSKRITYHILSKYYVLTLQKASDYTKLLVADFLVHALYFYRNITIGCFI